MSEVSTDKKLKGKDLITIGIFSAIYFVINFAFMLLGGIHPVLWMLMPGFIAVFAGIPFMLMVAMPMIGAHIPMRGCDIGIPMWAMHSARETMALSDYEALCQIVTAFFAD